MIAYACHGEPAVAIACVGFVLGMVFMGLFITLAERRPK